MIIIIIVIIIIFKFLITINQSMLLFNKLVNCNGLEKKGCTINIIVNIILYNRD